jgi:hypothetical protein
MVLWLEQEELRELGAGWADYARRNANRVICALCEFEQYRVGPAGTIPPGAIVCGDSDLPRATSRGESK